MSTVLYISYDGLTDPLGRTQVMPYVIGLARRGWRMAILSYEKPEATTAERARVKHLLDEAGVEWIPRTYHKTPTVPATAFDVTVGLVDSVRKHLRGGLVGIHARSYIAGSIGLAFKRALGVPLLFDMRGFWPDEKVEGGAWSKEGRIYQVMKGLEAQLFSAADAVVSLTHAGAGVLASWPSVGGRGIPLEVIPTCTDLAAFRDAYQRPREGPLTIGYLGSFGGRYLTDETVQVFKAVLDAEPATRFVVLTPREQDPLWIACERHDLPTDRVEARRVPSERVPEELSRMDATVSLIKPGFASVASCPTKFGESLAAGCPVVVNPGIGDCAELVRTHGLGAVTDGTRASLAEAGRSLVALNPRETQVRSRCRHIAEQNFDLTSAIDQYAALYERVWRRRAA